jgi:hypothetical protein
MELKTSNHQVFKKYYKDCCRIHTKVIKETKKIDYDRHIINSNNTHIMRTSWNLINKELGKVKKNHGIHSLHINGTSIINHQIIASAFNKHFSTLPTMITRKIIANAFSKISANNHNNLSFSLNNVFQTPFHSIKYHRTTTKEIENIIKSIKSSNSCGYDEVPMNLLKLCSSFISAPLNYICNRTLFTGIFPGRLKYVTIPPYLRKAIKII